jgi:hypothetical protein
MRVSNGGRGPKRRSAAEAFVEDGTQRVNIRRRADILAAGGLLGRHVAGRANDTAGAGGAVLVELLSQAEIGDLGDEIPPGFTSGSGRYRAGQCGAGQQHIGGLEVAVDDPRFVRGVHGTGQRLHQTGSLHRLERMFAELGIERATRAELQGHVRPAVVFADLKICTMLGCCKRAIARASMRKRSISVEPECAPARIIFRAQRRFSRTSRAR